MNSYLLIAAAVLVLATLYVARSRKRQKALHEACQRVFESAYAEAQGKPSFHMSYGYGVPIFKITHASREAHERSELDGANAAFRTGIQSVCGESGSQTNPYQADRAIYFAWLTVGNEVFYPQVKHTGGAGEA